MWSNKSWEPEAVLALIGGVMVSFFLGNLALGVLHQTGVAGFRSEVSVGSVLLASLSFHGAVIVLGAVFLKFHGQSWRVVFGSTSWLRCLVLACLVLAAASPVVLALKVFSEMVLEKLHWPVEDQMAIQMILKARPWICGYLAFFAVVLAPVGEELFFRGLLFQIVRRMRSPALVRFARQRGHPRLAWFLRREIWRLLAWVGVSFLFALFHANAPTFLPLFALALALTWLTEKTQGLLAPVLAHSLFNTANLVWLLVGEKYYHAAP